METARFFQKQTKRNKSLYVSMGILFIIGGVLNLIDNDESLIPYFGVVQIVAGACYILVSVLNLKTTSKYVPRLIISSKKIEFKKSITTKKITLTANEIKGICFRPETIDFNLDDTETQLERPFSMDGYDTAAIKTSITEFADEQSIPLKVISYR